MKLCRERAAVGFIACMALILGGAVGNLVDSIFYGLIYKNAPFGAPTPWFHGQVIDMIYVDIYEGFLPQSWLLLGGKYVSLWPIFNIADSSIFIGVTLILLNQSRFFQQEDTSPQPAPGAAKHRPRTNLTSLGPLGLGDFSCLPPRELLRFFVPIFPCLRCSCSNRYSLFPT